VLLERQQWPVIHAELVNGGARERRLVLPGEGSAQGLRTPLLAWSIRGPGDTRSHAYRRPSTPSHQCGNLPAPRREELVALAPGEARSFRPDITRLVLRTPGVYRVVLYYENDPGADWGAWRMLAGDEAAPWGEVAGSDAVRLASNELVFQVVE